MKKYFVFIVLFSLLGGIGAQAQLKFGLKAGVNLSAAPDLTNVGTAFSALNANNLTGFQIGPMIEFGFIDLAVLYSQHGFTVKKESILEDYKLNTLQIPLNLKLKLGILPKLLKVYGTAGPYINLNLSTNLKEQIKEQTFGAGLNFGLGVELLKHLQVGANYQLGLTNDYKKFGLTDVLKKDKPAIWSVTAAYLF